MSAEALLFNSLTDAEAPIVTCPPDQTVNNDLNLQTATVVWSTPSATDNSNTVATVTCKEESGSSFAIGETKVICTAVDQPGNMATCAFTVSVIGK